MRLIYVLLCLALLTHSCIPLRVAPRIEDHKITRGKKFKRSLSNRQMFIFENPKEADEFYEYVNIKFQLNHDKVYDDIPFVFEGAQFFFAWYEIEISDKHINLGPAVFDVALNGLLGNDDFQPYALETMDTFSRKGNWYLAIEVYSDSEKDCLAANALSRELVLKYLRALKQEYLATHNYNEVVFKN